MKVLHGISEVAGQGYYSVAGLRKIGCVARLAVWRNNPAGYPEDICLHIDMNKRYLYPWYAIKIFLLFVYAVFNYRTYHFHYGHTLLPKRFDWQILKLLKKEIVMEFHGSDLRDSKLACEINPYFALTRIETNDVLKKRNNFLGGFADKIILHDDELIPHLPSTTKANVYVVPLRVDIERFVPVYPLAEKGTCVTIVHAPSKRAVKGTDYILSAIERLSGKYEINFKLVENMTQEQAFKEYRKADIIIDQLLGGTYGVFAIEGMAMGKPVITYITDDMKTKLPEELPIVSATVDNIEEIIERLILDPKSRVELGKKSVAYVNKYHDYRKCAKVLLDIYENRCEPLTGRAAFERVGLLSE